MRSITIIGFVSMVLVYNNVCAQQLADSLSTDSTHQYRIKSLQTQMDAALLQSQKQEGAGKFKKAFDHYETFVMLKDSMMRLQRTHRIEQLQQKYQLAKKESEIVALQHEEELSKIDQREQDALLKQKDAEAMEAESMAYMFGWIAGGVVLLGIILFLLLRSRHKDLKKLEAQQLKIKQQNQAIATANDMIAAQNAEVAIHNDELQTLNEALDTQQDELEHRIREITDSIVYAKRLQQGVLPSLDTMRSIWPESFVYYVPKDIVSGDFYWLEASGDEVLFAVIDCTGHGVPGALMSMLGHNSLHRALHEYHKNSPAALLEQLDVLLRENLYKDESYKVNDGMDIAVGAINRKTKVLLWSGANNPLLLLRKGPVDDSLSNRTEIKLRESTPEAALYELLETERAIGGIHDEDVFQEYQLQLKPGDRLYLYSDGYSNQFGGDQGKKLKIVNFRKLLLEMLAVPMPEQVGYLQDYFNTWKGDTEQVDDICVMGIGIN